MNQQPSPNQFHYDLIAEAIRLLESDVSNQPSLEEIAAKMGFSPTHFQRMFSEWVGVSPKRYLQYLTLDHAKRLLEERFTVLDATLETGLSSPGRLHDLFVRWEAMSPGDYASGGAGLVISWGWFEGPFGPAIAMGTVRGLCGMGFVGGVRRPSPTVAKCGVS
jgi:AraC family transcriptional regulator of adaptative response/methylated-DNA-[protein]-cysteine methyltransferase